MRIIFMGTPDFAVESLKILVENKYNVVAVVTMPDKPAGRGHQLQFSAVKQYALSQNLTILQPEKLKDERFIEELSSLQADLQIVVAFRMLPEVVWNMPPLGTFNLHASLLPQYRGAAPINWAVINGETETGATTFFLTHEIDTGKIIQQKRISILPTDNAETVHDKLMVMGAELVKNTVDMLVAGKIDAVDQAQFIQPNTELKAAPKIFKESCEINLSWTVAQAHNFVRGMSPIPTAWVRLLFPGHSDKTTIKVYETEMLFEAHDKEIGTVITDKKKNAKIALSDGFLVLKQVQVAGKKRMEIGEMLRGMRFE